MVDYTDTTNKSIRGGITKERWLLNYQSKYVGGPIELMVRNHQQSTVLLVLSITIIYSLQGP